MTYAHASVQTTTGTTGNPQMNGTAEMANGREMTGMTELKPCPFCGEMPETEVEVTQVGRGEDHVDFKVVCGKCGTEKAMRLTIRQKCDFALVEQAMVQVASSWNRRVVKGKEGNWTYIPMAMMEISEDVIDE